MPDVAARVFGDALPAAEAFVAELAGAGTTRGVIGPREVPRLWDRHVLNCAVVEQLVPHGAAVVDVGSGAGLPGVVLALARPDLDLVLVDSAQRRVHWLEHVVDLMAGLGHPLRVRVVRGRAEELGGTVRGDVVTSRAVAPLDRLAGWCAPLVEVGGQLLAIKGGSAAEELREHGAALRAAGLTDAEVVTCGEDLLPEATTVVRARVERTGDRRGGRPVLR